MRKTLSVLAIIAALSSTALAESSATFTGGTITYGIYYYGNGNVTVSDGPATGVNSVYGRFDRNSSVSGASVTMDGGTIEDRVYGAGTNAGSATSNTVTISGGTVGGEVKGGDGYGADANNNTVTISGGTLKDTVYGGSGKLNANGNTVVISGGTIESSTIYGGYNWSGNANGTKDNTVTISGGTFTNTEVEVAKGGYKESSGNTLNLVGEGGTLDTLTGSSFSLGALKGDYKGNAALNVYGKGITAGSVEKFKELNFHLTANIANADTMLTLSGSTNTNLSGATVNVKCSGDTQLNGGDIVNLIHHSGDGTVLVAEDTTTNVDIIKGVSATYAGTVAVSADKKDLVLTLEGGSAPDTNDEALKSMTETRTDVAALVNSAADFMATTGVQQAKLAAKVAALTGKDGAAPFMALGGSSMRYNTGSHVDANGFNGALGVAKAFDDITLGVAGEYGISSYKSYVGSTNGKGNSKLYGGALLADWQDKQGWHAEGAVRLGRTSTDYSAATALGHTHYTDHASYQGALIGGGKEFKVSRKCDDTVDLYARYMYSHTNGSNTTATSGEAMHFAGVDSHRTMVGARYNHELSDSAVVYAGAAWMHEFDGDAHSVIGGFTAPSPSLEGDSGMVEIGTTFAPCASENILLNLNLQGWTGVQRGISGGAGCTIKF